MCQICKMFCQTRSWEGIHVLCFALVKSPPTHPCPPWAPGAPIGNSSFLYQTSHLSQREGIDRHTQSRGALSDWLHFSELKNLQWRCHRQHFCSRFPSSFHFACLPHHFFTVGYSHSSIYENWMPKSMKLWKYLITEFFSKTLQKHFILSKFKPNKGGFLLHIRVFLK